MDYSNLEETHVITFLKLGKGQWLYLKVIDQIKKFLFKTSFKPF